MVSVPSFGDSFFIESWSLCLTLKIARRFRPLIRGFFFYWCYSCPDSLLLQRVSVPSFGDSFFMGRHEAMEQHCLVRFPSPHSGILFLFKAVALGDGRYAVLAFPSPHSGILFLSCRYDMPPSLNIFAIFRRILHLLAQKGFPLTQSIHFSPYPSASARIKSFFIHIVPSPIPLNQYIITSSSFISPMPHDLTLVWS